MLPPHDLAAALLASALTLRRDPPGLAVMSRGGKFLFPHIELSIQQNISTAFTAIGFENSPLFVAKISLIVANMS
ncbi:MAG TPA: hypothetical protein VHU15_16040 [Stellaceae bacterium]|jgi:hypothetical protein|nr:hypothetical protein [Stellaceae bacterium]